MDVRAILLVGGGKPANATGSPAESIGGIPFAYLDVLGLPVLERVLQGLQRFGVSAATVISDASAEAAPFLRRATLRPDLATVEASGGKFWQAAEEAFLGYAQNRAELVIALRLGPYSEVDYEELIQHHLDHRCPVTMAAGLDGGALDLFVLSASRRNDVSTLFRSELQKLRTECPPFRVSGYVNRLQTQADLRCLALDGLLHKNAIRPVGNEIKPGVWMGEAARIHPKARVTAPAFIGAHAKVRASALITRGSVLEHHAEIDCGTVVENSSVLPYSYVGAGLDVVHSVVGFRRLTQLTRNIEVEIADSKLIGMTAISAISRMAGSAAALLAFLPKQIYRGFFRKSEQASTAEIPESLEQKAVLQAPVGEAQGPGPEASEFPTNFAVARRYGEP